MNKHTKDSVLSAASQALAVGNTVAADMLVEYAKLLDAAGKVARKAVSDADDDAYMRKKPWFGQRVGWVRAASSDPVVVWPTRGMVDATKVRIVDYRVFTPERSVARVLQGFVDELPGGGMQSELRPILDKAARANMLATVDEKGKVHVDRQRKCLKTRTVQ